MAFDKILTGVKFYHSENAGMTFAYRLNGDTVEYGVAYTHDNDRYNHKMGRQIAQGRMLRKRGFHGSVPVSDVIERGGITYSNIVNAVDADRVRNHIMPAVNLCDQ